MNRHTWIPKAVEKLTEKTGNPWKIEMFFPHSKRASASKPFPTISWTVPTWITLAKHETQIWKFKNKLFEIHLKRRNWKLYLKDAFKVTSKYIPWGQNKVFNATCTVIIWPCWCSHWRMHVKTLNYISTFLNDFPIITNDIIVLLYRIHVIFFEESNTQTIGFFCIRKSLKIIDNSSEKIKF